MPQLLHTAQTPDIPRLLEILADYDVRYVLTGSVAAAVYGVEIGPAGDLDITPAMDRKNLQHLASVLGAIEAGISGGRGHWTTTAEGEKKWVTEDVTPEESAAISAAWFPDPDDIATLDHRFLTRYGNFDVVPELGGTYEALMQRAVRMSVYDHTISVAHIDDLLAALTVPRRRKDISRVRQLRAIQRARGLPAQ